MCQVRLKVWTVRTTNTFLTTEGCYPIVLDQQLIEANEIDDVGGSWG